MFEVSYVVHCGKCDRISTEFSGRYMSLVELLNIILKENQDGLVQILDIKEVF